MIKQESIDHLKSVIDIVDVVGRYIEVKKAGPNFKAICPFHDEKTPSFVISPSKQRCHCFSCHTGGDAIRFVQEFEKISYPEAIEKLASLYNVQLEYTHTTKAKPKIMEAVNRFYIRCLEHSNEVKSYISSRAIASHTTEKFELGFAPLGHETLSFIKESFLSMEEGIETGVLGSDGNRTYARLFERLTFPIYNATGSAIIGFGGRTLGNHPAKYINSPQTPYFNKSQVLYAYHLAKESIHKHKKILITEGYLDVIMLHQAGFDNAVATLGTALTKEHFPLLRRGEPAIVLAYDGDKAGQTAAFKGAQLLLSGGFRGGVVLFDQGKDPADMVKENRIEELSHLFDHPVSFVSFVLRGITHGYDVSQTDQKEKAFQEIQTFLLTLSPFLQEEFKAEAASLLGINPTLLRTKFAKTKPSSLPLARPNYDMQEAILLKTAHTFPPLIERLLDFGSREIFHLYHDAFDALVWHTPSHPLLDEILFDDSIKTIHEEEEIKKAIFYQKEKFLQRKLDTIKNDSSLSISAKAFEIRKSHEQLLRLKKGDFSPLA